MSGTTASKEILSSRIEHVWFDANGYMPVKQIREKAKELAQAIDQLAPHCPDKTAAFRKLREAVIMAEMAVSCGGK